MSICFITLLISLHNSFQSTVRYHHFFFLTIFISENVPLLKETCLLELMAYSIISDLLCYLPLHLPSQYENERVEKLFEEVRDG